jgi:Protein of unknown function (DUF4065)
VDTAANPDIKLGEMMIYLAGKLVDQPAAGATKLNKLLFFAEFAHVRVAGQPISGVEYQKLANGPAPRRLLPVRDRLVGDGAAELVDESYGGRVQHRLRPLRPAKLEVFTESELHVLDQVVRDHADSTGTRLSELSHLEPAWNLVDEKETIPFSAAFLRGGRPGEKALDRARDLAEINRRR